MRQFRSKCKACSRVYSLESSNSDHCSQCQTNINLQKNCCPNMTCKSCDKKYYSPNYLRRCPFCAITGYSNENKKPKVYDNSKITKKGGRQLPLEVLNRMAEYKRVFDDSGWGHYLKGRKWDRI